MRRALPAVAAALLLAAPTALAFFSGGFFTEPRLIAAIAAWVLVFALALAGPAPLPRSLAGWLALGGLAALGIWSAISIAWAPLRAPAQGNVEEIILYAGALIVAIGALRSPRAMRAVEPALAAGAAIVICYGLSGRLLPGLVHLAHSSHAGGRLEQPITYWNSEGLLAAFGLVLCARLAGDVTRPAAMRALGAAAAAPLGAGIYLSYSRGAIAACAVGLLILVTVWPVRPQIRGVGVALVAGVLASVCASQFPGVASLDGGSGAKERDGAIVLVVLVVIAAAAAFVSARGAREDSEAGVPAAPVPGARRRWALTGTVVALAAIGLLIGGLREKVSAADLANASPTRLTSVSSNRYDYWRISGRAFVRHPLAGLGSGGFRVFWLRERPIRESVQNSHSLELETAAELGVVGLLALAAMFAGIVLAARRALERQPGIAAGWCAAAVVWFLHASIDWDWQLPAVTLPLFVLAGALIVLAEAPVESATEPGTARARAGWLSSRQGLTPREGAVPAP